MKPFLVGSILEEIRHVVTEKKILVSVAAGVPIEFMEDVSLAKVLVLTTGYEKCIKISSTNEADISLCGTFKHIKIKISC